MGHYRGEMVSEKEEKARFFEESRLRARRTERVKKMIEEYGLEETLVRLFEDDHPRLKLGY